MVVADAWMEHADHRSTPLATRRPAHRRETVPRRSFRLLRERRPRQGVPAAYRGKEFPQLTGELVDVAIESTGSKVWVMMTATDYRTGKIGLSLPR
jgi:hypothetical protein